MRNAIFVFMKLTLSLDEAVVEKARAYAKAHNTSLSKLVEHYLARVAGAHEYPVPEDHSFTSELAGMLNEPAQGFTYEDAKYRHLKKRYGL